MKAKIGIINVSDRASRGEYEDLPGKEVKRLLNRYLLSEWEPVYAVVPDETDEIAAELIRMTDREKCGLVITTGGTGPAIRDVTPEATEQVCDKILPGFGEQMRMESLKFVPTAIVSRQTAGVRKSTLIINLPGRVKAIEQCLSVVFAAVPYCVELIGGPKMKTNPEWVKAKTPKPQ